MSCIRSFPTQSLSPPVRWRCTNDDDDPDMIWAALGTLMQTSLRSGYNLIGDICPNHIDICADHCWSLIVLVHRYHGSCIRCPAFASWTDRTVSKTDRTGCIVSRTVWSVLSRIDHTSGNGLIDGWMDWWNRFLKRCSTNIEGSSPLLES